MTSDELKQRLNLSSSATVTPRAALVALFGEARVRCLPDATIDILGRRLISAGSSGEPGDTTAFDRVRESLDIALTAGAEEGRLAGNPCFTGGGATGGGGGYSAATGSAFTTKRIIAGTAGIAAAAAALWAIFGRAG